MKARCFKLALREFGIACTRIRVGHPNTTAMSKVSTGWIPNITIINVVSCHQQT